MAVMATKEHPVVLSTGSSNSREDGFLCFVTANPGTLLHVGRKGTGKRRPGFSGCGEAVRRTSRGLGRV
jgi:hypothetical protein